MIDLDAFKQLNDTLGHQLGDEILQLAARALRTNCRQSDVAGRFGGDEFILLLPRTDKESAKQVAARILEQFQLSTKARLDGCNWSGDLSMSIGVATVQHSNPSGPERLIAQADHALYLAKQAGKTQVVVFNTTAPARDARTANT